MFQIAGHTMGTPEYSVVQAIELFHSIGLHGAEIVVQNGYLSGLEEHSSIRELEDVKRCAKRNHIEIVCLTPYYSKFNSLNDKEREADESGIRRVIKFAEYLGARFVRIYGGNFAAGETDPDGRKRERLIHSMQSLADAARSSGVILAIENHFNTMTVSAAESNSISREINRKEVGILYDQANLSFTGKEDYRTAIALMAEKIVYTHVKDLAFKKGDIAFVSTDVSHPREEDRNVETRIVGEGEMDWRSILAFLSENGLSDGWLSLEYERRWHPKDIPDASTGMKKSFDYISQVLTQIGDTY